MKELVKRLEKRAAHVDTESFKYELFPDEIALYKHHENQKCERGRKFIILKTNGYEITVGWYWRNFETKYADANDDATVICTQSTAADLMNTFIDFAESVEEGNSRYEQEYDKVVKAVEIARWGRLFLCLYQAVTRLKDYLK